MTPENRIPRAIWVDTARCLAMLPILWLHAGDAPDVLSLPVGGAICLFFVLAGYFIPRQAGACAARAGKLTLAWLLWTLLSWGLYYLATPSQACTWQQALGWGTAALNTPLWFLRNLFIYQLIFAGLIYIGLLPRYSWLWLILLASCCYAADPPQHESLRFDWMSSLALGFCLRQLDLENLRGHLARYTPPLLLAIGLLFAQWHLYPDILQAEGLGIKTCGLPVAQLAWATLYLLAGIGMQKHVPRAADLMAKGGESMLFCYAAHSFLYAPLYAYGIRWASNFWAPLLALPLLTLLHRTLRTRIPLLTRLLCAK